MRLSQIGELTLIETIRKRFAQATKDIPVGIGDDSAVIKTNGKNLLITTDMMVEGIHFDLKLMSSYQLGFKLVSINVSDIYAMGGIPKYLLLNIAVNKKTECSSINRFFDGIGNAMDLYGLSLIGGDISASENEVVAASLIGYADRPVKRSGARPGDKIYVTGNLGDSACGLEILKRLTPESIQTVKSEKLKVKNETIKNIFLTRNSQLETLNWSMAKPLLKRHLIPVARNPEKFVKHATAMIDISDGLFIDLTRLCNESKVGAKIYAKDIPVSVQTIKASSTLGIDSFKLAVSGGEDYELLFTASRNSKLETRNSKLKITCIGEITKKNMIVVDEMGKKSILKAEGYQHFGIKG